jgi:chromosome transmission fidelity protein 18
MVLAKAMPLSSSPVRYPQSSSPPMIGKKRKLFQSWKPEEQQKKRRMLGGFILDEEEEEEDSVLTDAKQPPPPSLAANTKSDSWRANESNSVGDKVAVRSRSPSLPPLPPPDRPNQVRHSIPIQTSSGHFIHVSLRPKAKPLSYEETIARRSTTAPGRAKKAYYGIDIHNLLDEHKIHAQVDATRRRAKQLEKPHESIEPTIGETSNVRSSKYQMWTEKYRARKFTDLIGDERTHRSVLRWLKSWDPVVFPGSTKQNVKKKQPFGFADLRVLDESSHHRKILLLTGPPGLGKTTLAHVCARQAGYETLEINASDERSRDVVKGRIRDAIGTENVRGIDVVKGGKKTRKAGRPVCVVVDEVDGVTSGSSGGGGEGGFMKALVDLIQLDEKNSQLVGHTSAGPRRTKKGEKFRLLRPIILVCNDLYAPALRPLRTSSCAEIIHVRKPPIEKAIARLTSIFEKERISSDGDAVRRLCEASWGTGSRAQGRRQHDGAGEGDMRGVLVQCEWIAHKLRSTSNHGISPRLTKIWVDENILNSTNHSLGGLGRGGSREIIERVFTEGAGLPNLPTKTSAEDAKVSAGPKTAPVGISELRKRAAMTSIREMVDTLGDHDRLMTDCFTTYPSQVYQDDTYLTKPVAAYDWLHFHDMLSSRIFGAQEWELNPYLGQSVCAFHHLFATVTNEKHGWDADNSTSAEKEVEAQSHPFSGPRADFAAYEAEKANRAVVTEFQSSFSAPLLRLYRTADAIAAELIPNVTRMLAPEVKPVVVGGSAGQGSVASVRKESEKNCVRIGSRVMSGLNVTFEKVRIEIEGGGAHSHGGFALRMEP